MTKILRARAVAERLGCSVSTLYRWAKSGAFPQQIRLSSAYVGWREDEIEVWIESRERGAFLNPGNRRRRDLRDRENKNDSARSVAERSRPPVQAPAESAAPMPAGRSRP